MGLGFYAIAEVKSRGLLNFLSSKEKILKEIEKLFNLQKDSLFNRLIITHNLDDKLQITLHPAEEPIEFYFENNKLICSAKTNDAGPGYHSFLINRLDEIKTKLNVQWVWEDAEGNIGDETGFVQNRDFHQLQVSMMDWLDALIKNTLDDDKNGFYLSMDINIFKDQKIAEDFFALSPMGFWQKEWFKTFMKTKNEKEKLDYCSQFFPWWEEGLNGRFWLNTAVSYMWQYLPWHKPLTKEEKEPYLLVKDCLERAYSLDNTLEFPWAEWKEILEYLDDNKQLAKPNSRIKDKKLKPSIGFYRRLMRRPLTGNWNIVVPGYFYFQREKNGEEVIYWYDDKNVRASSFTVNKSESKKLMNRNKSNDVKKSFNFKKGKLECQARLSEVKENDNKYFALQGFILWSDSLAILTITFHNPKDEIWALNTIKSVELSSD